jgi:hypothetical protein
MIMEKEVFERMVSEFNEVLNRTEDLRAFLLDEEKMKDFDPLQRDLLVAQLKAMESYVAILSIRIGLNAPREELAQPADTEETVVPEAVND